jgi:hypothetical protein
MAPIMEYHEAAYPLDIYAFGTYAVVFVTNSFAHTAQKGNGTISFHDVICG